MQDGLQDPARTPEAGSRPAAYGSAFHDAVAALEDGHDDAGAVQVAWDAWGHWLDPTDLERLRADVETFHLRDFQGVRTVLCEDEIRVPLTLADGELAFFRARIDRLYERLDAPGAFIHVDYKTSVWPKSETEVQEDLQMWAYNWALHEALPEIVELDGVYDQLRFGQIHVRKSDAQRAQMRDWLIAQMSTYFADDRIQADGLLPWRYNRWCGHCELVASCPVVEHLTEFARSRIAAISGEEIEAGPLDPYADLFTEAKGAAKVLDAFIERVRALAHDLPPAERDRLGLRVSVRNSTTFPPDALARLRERVGDHRFLELVSLPKARLQTLDPDVQEWALSMLAPAPSTMVTRKETKSKR